MKLIVVVFYWYLVCIFFKVEVLKVLKLVFYIKIKINEKFVFINLFLLCIYVIIMYLYDYYVENG